MSYEISNYVFKGLSLDELIDRLDDDHSMDLSKGDGDQVNLLIVEDNLINCLNDILGSSEFNCGEDSFKTKDVAKALAYESWGQNYISVDGKDTEILGVKELLVRAILIGCGISSDDLMPNSDINQTCSSYMNLNGMTGWPFLERKGKVLAYGALEIPECLNYFCHIAARKLNWAYATDPLMDHESCKWNAPEFKFSLKKILAWVQSTNNNLGHDYWREKYSSLLINRGLKIENYYIEDEQSFAVSVSVESTRYGDVHNSGGMESNVLYLSVSGDMDIYNEEGWCDPEKETPLAFKKTKELLFGDENYDLNKYTPQFSG